MSMVKTNAAEIGEVVAEAIRDTMGKATAGLTLATYIEGDAPVSWESLGDAGWDLAGITEDENSATLRDLVEIAGAWGGALVQLPLLTTILAKRHSPAAAETDGPVTFSVPVASLPAGSGLVPFGQVPGIALVTSFAGAGQLAPLPTAEPVDFAPSLRAASIGSTTELSDGLRHELPVVWAAEAAGVARRVLDLAVEFTKERQQFGKPIGSFQAVKHHLASAHMAAEHAETAAIWASLEPERSAAAVRQSFRESVESIQLSIHVYGGLGFTWEMGVHFSLRHVWALRELATGVSSGA